MGRTRSPFASKPVLENLDQISRELRLEILAMCQRAKLPLPAKTLSCLDILVTLYWIGPPRLEPRLVDDPARDRFIFDKADATCALYAVLARRGYFPIEELQHFNETDARLARQPVPGTVPGFEWSAGSPGESLSVASGMALAAHVQSAPSQVFVLMDDRDRIGETARSMALLAPRLGLGNLTAIIEIEASDEDAAKRALEDWRSFGWSVREVDGHDPVAIAKALQTRRSDSVPLAILAATVKGKGVALLESGACDQRPPTADELEIAKKELAL